jgi:hypothetical protein
MSGLRLDAPIQFTKREIAQIQLAEAISLFLQQKYLPCVTLAGAAEEILARLANQTGNSSIAELSFQEVQRIREETGVCVMGEVDRSKVFNLWNSARNALKHHNKNGEEVVLFHPYDDAYMMIRRALFNAKEAGVPIGNEADFENFLVGEPNP